MRGAQSVPVHQVGTRVLTALRLVALALAAALLSQGCTAVEPTVPSPVPVQVGTPSVQAEPSPSTSPVIEASPTATGTSTPEAAATMSPSPSPPVADQPTYLVQAGDTLFGLARRFALPPADLARINGLPPDAHLRVGQTLRLPDGVWSDALGIRLISPEPGSAVRAPVAVEGTAATFESTVLVEVLAADGAELGQGIATAQSPDVGQHGLFQVAVAFPPSPSERNATLRVYWPSPRDGLPRDEIRVPLTLLPER
ncbi:MAG: LysM peptidoglycan-binding domain-containing protein [Chloroflexi bacterium]|nr:LysM peptidoglycan-binding domain-containing protein [Chloroflexota bacterium]